MGGVAQHCNRTRFVLLFAQEARDAKKARLEALAKRSAAQRAAAAAEEGEEPDQAAPAKKRRLRKAAAVADDTAQSAEAALAEELQDVHAADDQV
jgi:hypothetical protein